MNLTSVVTGAVMVCFRLFFPPFLVAFSYGFYHLVEKIIPSSPVPVTSETGIIKDIVIKAFLGGVMFLRLGVMILIAVGFITKIFAA